MPEARAAYTRAAVAASTRIAVSGWAQLHSLRQIQGVFDSLSFRNLPCARIVPVFLRVLFKKKTALSYFGVSHI